MSYAILFMFVSFVGFVFFVVSVLVYTASERENKALKNKPKKESSENILDDDLD